MNIALIKPSEKTKAQLFDMLEEWTQDIEANHTNSSPRRIFLYDYHNFEQYLGFLETKEKPQTEEFLVRPSFVLTLTEISLLAQLISVIILMMVFF